MKSRNFTIFSVLAAALLLSTIAVTPVAPEDALAYEKNQATSQTSACGNDFMPVNLGCQNTDSRIQGDENAAALTAQQTFPEVKKEPKPPKTATLQVCKDVDSAEGVFEFTVSGVKASPEQFSLMPGDCQDVTVSPGDYEVGEAADNFIASVSGDCELIIGTTTAGGNIQAGDTQSCIFLNIEEEPQTCEECFTRYLTDEQITVFLSLTSFENLEELCEYLESATPQEQRFVVRVFGDFLKNGVPHIGVDPITDGPTADRIKECLQRILGLPTEAEPIES
ncbi:MAG TPA: hypothetical protein VE130_13505 [Nitrososphaeraceae archaeon]|nr:hypothetical protein [Nitrososphaeraceae archaeon]